MPGRSLRRSIILKRRVTTMAKGNLKAKREYLGMVKKEKDIKKQITLLIMGLEDKANQRKILKVLFELAEKEIPKG
jgi:hypothetical protein